MSKLHPEYVIPELVRKTIETGKERSSLFSEYIRWHYKCTGKLAPGCDAKDFYAVLDEMMKSSK